MADLQLGQKVSVNLVGLHVAEVEFGGSTTATGTVEEIDLATKRNHYSPEHFVQRASVSDRFTRSSNSL